MPCAAWTLTGLRGVSGVCLRAREHRDAGANRTAMRGNWLSVQKLPKDPEKCKLKIPLDIFQEKRP